LGCKHFHTKYTCTNTQCDISTCSARHPRPCKYYSQSGFCKFGQSCSYGHQDKKSDVDELKINIQQVMDSLKNKETEIKDLEKKVIMLEESIKQLNIHKEEVKFEPKPFKCDICADEAVSSTALTTKKHKCVMAAQEAAAGLPIAQLDGHSDACEVIEYSINPPFKCEVCQHEVERSHFHQTRP
jgi:hypothetical protein